MDVLLTILIVSLIIGLATFDKRRRERRRVEQGKRYEELPTYHDPSR